MLKEVKELEQEAIDIHIEGWAFHEMQSFDGYLNFTCFAEPKNLLVEVMPGLKVPFGNDQLLMIRHGEEDSILCLLQNIQLDQMPLDEPSRYMVRLKVLDKDRLPIFMHNVCLEAWGQPYDAALMRYEKVERIPYD